ncbi:MAG TPA: mechanosensitive ion channel family protein [Vicinamibacterales bacterium]|nr:mechanosensitive ion channel family protein [Vicinamibacterales bacterium]
MRVLGACVFALVLSAPLAPGQTLPGAASSPPAAPAQAPSDPLNRDTPRGTVQGFLSAARQGQSDLASQYLNTSLTGQAAADLAQQLFVVLDARLQTSIRRLSDAPEGSRANPLRPNQEVVGVIESGGGNEEIVVVRIERGSSGPIWLFSERTLSLVPTLYEEITLRWTERILPRFLTARRIGGVRLFEWLTVLLGLPLFYVVTALLNRVLTPLIRGSWRRIFRQSDLFAGNVLPAPVRLLLLAFAIRWVLATLPLSLLVRQVWSNAASLINVAAVVWLLVLLNGEIEQFIRRRFPRANVSAGASLLRLLRRVFDLLVIFVGMMAVLRRFGVDPTPALAGLGVGGIAVALAAQKTLENLVAGASLLFDQAVRVGDFMKMGDIAGTIDHIGLRSTRIRTLDRTIVIVPNSQIANASLETISARDKFWFHPVVGLRYETTPEQLRAVVDGIRGLLEKHRSIDRESVRVRFFRLGAFSLDVDVFAYLYARDWNHFLEIQEQLLFGVTEIVSRAGTEIAFPSQTMYVANAPAAAPTADSVPGR